MLNVSVSSLADADDFETELRRELRAHNDGASDLVVARCDLVENADVLTSILSAVPLGVEPTRLGRLRSLAGALQMRAFVFVLRGAEGHLSTSGIEGVSALTDEVRKFHAAARLAVVSVEWPGGVHGRTVADFRVGFPENDVLGSVSRVEVWRRYVHSRVAWECGGDAELARRWSLRGFGSLPTGRDEDLEALLNRCATDEVAQRRIDVATTSGVLRSAVLSGFRAAGEQARTALVIPGVVWHPPGGPRWKPSPWFSRAALRSSDHGAALGVLFRSSLVCAPLAHELLERCLQLEYHERALCRAQGEERGPSEDARRQFDDFHAGASRSDRPLYPRGCPASPDEAWYFASFGEFLDAFRLDDGRHGLRHDLRDLRNSLAHGRYVSWYAIDRLMRIESALTA